MKKVVFACLSVLLCAGCTAELFQSETKEDPKVREKTWSPAIEKFSSCAEINQYIEAFRSQYPDPVSNIGSDMPGSNPEQTYQNQVEGVLEGDLLQISPEFFFYASKNKVEIMTKKPLSLYKSLSTPASSSRWLLLNKTRLIYVGSYAMKTVVQIYDVAKDFDKIFEREFVGGTIDFRLVENRLRLVTKDYYGYYGSHSAVDCTQVYRPNLEDGDESITFVHEVNLTDKSFKAASAGFMGGADFIHVTSDELLLFKNTYTIPSHFRVIHFGGHQPVLEQVQTYEGILKDRWSVLAKDGFLILASTLTGNSWGFRDNKLFTYEKMRGLQYELASETPSFGENENIRAVRYFMDKAYVVTFRQTDPLFIFDIKNPKDMKLLGSLESPGFSAQLRELSNGIMFGIGFAENQNHLKVSLFDVLDPLKPTEEQALIWGSKNQYYSSSRSDATFDPKALFISQEKDRIIFPATMTDYDSTSYWRFDGALILDFRGKQVREAGRITHLPFREKICKTDPWNYLPSGVDVQRAVQIEGDILSFSRFGAMRSSAKDFSTQEQVAFNVTADSCY